MYYLVLMPVALSSGRSPTNAMQVGVYREDRLGAMSLDKMEEGFV